MTKKTHQFQAEVKEILDLMVHSLYSNREIFLRELVSNASDALDKLRFEEASDPSLATGEEKYIRLVPNKEAKTLTIIDNGIGMTSEEVLKNIGTIAHSGTKSFIEKAKEIKERPDLIGQFGVGFYSSFMVADKVTLHTQKAGTQDGVIWESAGDGAYTLEDSPRELGHGTSITLHFKDFKDDETAQDYTDEFVLRRVIKKYSDFIEFSIKMEVTKELPELDAEGKPVEGKTKSVVEDEVLNSKKAIWLRSPSEVSDEEYNDFYKHVSKDWNDPLSRIYYRAEGTQEFTSLLFVPKERPFDYNYRDTKWGLSLYVNRVFIMENCEELLPPYFRFVKGVIDSSDLSLNVSREILQQDRQIAAIRKALTGKILRELKTMLNKDRSKYEGFWEVFGSTLKEGVANDLENKSKLEELSLFKSSNVEGLTTLKEYVERMAKDQKEIYYITGESVAQVESSPYMERLKEKGFEVLYCVDPVDEWVMQAMTKYDDKDFRSITKEGLDLDSEEDKKRRDEERKVQESDLKPLIETIQGAVSEYVKEVKISDRLVDSPVCLVSGAYDQSAHMERMMKAMGQEMPAAKRIMEINPKHAVFGKMKDLSEDKQKLWAEILYNEALLNEGTPIADPVKFTKQITSLMVD